MRAWRSANIRRNCTRPSVSPNHFAQPAAGKQVADVVGHPGAALRPAARIRAGAARYANGLSMASSTSRVGRSPRARPRASATAAGRRIARRSQTPRPTRACGRPARPPPFASPARFSEMLCGFVVKGEHPLDRGVEFHAARGTRMAAVFSGWRQRMGGLGVTDHHRVGSDLVRFCRRQCRAIQVARVGDHLRLGFLNA